MEESCPEWHRWRLATLAQQTEPENIQPSGELTSRPSLERGQTRMAEKLDPFDVAALERSLNDSATRVSTIWVSFLIFSLYLLIAAATIEHRQLLLAEPVKLPVLNIDLPLWGFFFLAPMLFVIFHAYVLIQVLLLGRTAATYEEAVERAGLPPEENASLRQRLANTLFAQIFAGSPRERAGWLGWLLKAMAWITLALAPILILLVFQFMFLPYHSHLATWTHRLLILVELAVVFLLWPLVLDARRDFEWLSAWTQLRRASALPLRLLGPNDRLRDEWLWLRQQAIPLTSCVLFVFLSLSLATFPGEPHVNLFTGQPLASVQCKRWLSAQFDRLVLPRVDVVDDEKLKKIQEATKIAGEPDFLGERTQKFRDRDLNCSNISDYADLRRVDLTQARLRGANFEKAKLQGAALVGTQLQGASLGEAQLQGASLVGAQLQNASLYRAQLQDADLKEAQLRGAVLFGAELQGASLVGAHLQGAALNDARLQGASLADAHLQGAGLVGVQLQGAFLGRAHLQGAEILNSHLQGASLVGAQLQGASFLGAQLQGADLDAVQLQGASLYRSPTTYTRFSEVYVWRTKNAACDESRVRGHKPEAIVELLPIPDSSDKPVRATPDTIAKFIERSIADIPVGRRKEAAGARLRAGLMVDWAKNDSEAIAEVWSTCEKASAEPSEKDFDHKFDQNHADFLRKLVCEDTQYGKAMARGIIRNWISDDSDRRDFSVLLARGLLSRDGRECAGTKDLDGKTKDLLLSFLPASERATGPKAPRVDE